MHGRGQLPEQAGQRGRGEQDDGQLGRGRAGGGRSGQRQRRQRVQAILPILNQLYPDARCSLDHRSPLELLVATILSAQCTDDRVNIVTKTLFKKYRKPQDYANVPQDELEKAFVGGRSPADTTAALAAAVQRAGQ